MTPRFISGERKVSKYCEHDCLQSRHLLSISLLTALNVENCQILAGLYFFFLKNRRRPNLKCFKYQI